MLSMVLYRGQRINWQMGRCASNHEEKTMAKLDRALADRMIANLENTDDATTPLWGSMTLPQMRGHLIMILRYTMGQGDDMPCRGNWMMQNVFKHVIVNGWREIPRNVKLPKNKSGKKLTPRDATNEELAAALSAFLDAFEEGKLGVRTHPFFGPLTPAQWQKFHHAHCMHHLKQFGCW